FARRLAENGCRVIIPTLIDRTIEARNGRAKLTSREYLYRSAFELGRHLIGYEVQKALAAVDWFAKDAGKELPKIGVVGWGEGGLIALYTAALDPRIRAACVSGYFDDRRSLWQEPIDRNVFGLLEQFGDAELASLIAPRALIIEAAKGPELTLPGQGGAPARLVTPKLEDVFKEVRRAAALAANLKPVWEPGLVVSSQGQGAYLAGGALGALLRSLSPKTELAEPGKPPEHLRKGFDPKS